MLQRAWNPDPQNLPFAQNIKTHALVSLVQKGLQYHELEQLVDRVRYSNLASWRFMWCPNNALVGGKTSYIAACFFFRPISS